MRKFERRSLLFGLSLTIIAISGVFIILNAFQIKYQQAIIEKQKQIMDENRHWVEKVPFYEVTGGLADQIIEGEKIYNEALSKYSTALQTQILAILLIILLGIVLIITMGFLIIKFGMNRVE